MIFFQSIESLQKLLREARGSVTFKVEAKLKIKELENILLFLKLSFSQAIFATNSCTIHLLNLWLFACMFEDTRKK